MTFGGQPGKNGPWQRRPGDNGGTVPPQWGYGQQDETPAPGQPPGKSWPARHKALTGLLAVLVLIIIVAAARSGGPSAPPGKGTTAGLTTTASPTATQSPSHHATRAAATARQTQSQKTQPATPATSHRPTPSAPAAPTTPAAVIAPPPSAPPPSAMPTSGPPSSAAPPGCHPLTNAGNCYEPGEFCRAADHGASGVAGDGEPITCADNDGWRWEPA